MIGSLWGCGEEPAPAPTPEVCARAGAEVVAGDAQGDGVCDLADAVAVMRADFDGGATSACLAAVDPVPDGRALADDAQVILQYLFEGTGWLPELGRQDCAEAAAWPAGPCGALGLGWEAPTGPAAGAFEVALTLTTDLPVEAWAVSVAAEGCQITGARVDGTAAADTTADAAGLRDLGYQATYVRNRVAFQGVVLGLPDAVALPGDGAPTPVLRLDVESECGACTLTAGDGPRGFGAPLTAVAVVGGYALPLPASTLQVAVCP